MGDKVYCRAQPTENLTKNDGLRREGERMKSETQGNNEDTEAVVTQKCS